MTVKSVEPRLEEDFHIDLEGTRGIRVLLYEEDAQQMAILRGKAELEVIEIYGYTLMITMFCNPFL